MLFVTVSNILNFLPSSLRALFSNSLSGACPRIDNKLVAGWSLRWAKLTIFFTEFSVVEAALEYEQVVVAVGVYQPVFLVNST